MVSNNNGGDWKNIFQLQYRIHSETGHTRIFFETMFTEKYRFSLFNRKSRAVLSSRRKMVHNLFKERFPVGV